MDTESPGIRSLVPDTAYGGLGGTGKGHRIGPSCAGSFSRTMMAVTPLRNCPAPRQPPPPCVGQRCGVSLG
jgi:hypothetical protein